MARYIFITGGVVSSLGKGLASAALGALLQARGYKVRLRKLDAAYDASDKVAAMTYLESRRAKGEVVTGLLYVDPESHDLHEHFNTTDTPLNRLGAESLSPGAKTLEKINASLR